MAFGAGGGGRREQRRINRQKLQPLNRDANYVFQLINGLDKIDLTPLGKSKPTA